MFTIQYKAIDGTHKLQSLDTERRSKLLVHLARFDRPITAVYEQASPITKAVQKELRAWAGRLSREAREFAFMFQA